MPFTDAARARVGQLAPDDPARVILDYMLNHAVGVQNAKPWRAIQDELRDNDITMTKEQFQQTVLAETRAGDIWIGSKDHGRPRGYFLIQDHGDAMTARNFIADRIAAQQANLNNLDRLIDIEWETPAPGAPPPH